MKKVLLAFLLVSDIALAAPLDSIGTFCSSFPDQCRKGTMSLLAAKGTTDDVYYVLEVDPVTGQIPVSATFTPAAPGGRTYADSVRLDYSGTPVTTGAWVELIASTAATINCLNIFDSSGRTLELGTGAAASETRVMIVPPGGLDGCTDLLIPASSRLSIRAISANATVGEIDITGLN